MALANREANQADFENDDRAPLSAPRWKRCRVPIASAAALVGSLCLIDPLLLWLSPTTILFLLALIALLRQADWFGKLAALKPLIGFGLITVLIGQALIPFCWVTRPIRRAGGRVETSLGTVSFLFVGKQISCSVTLHGAKIADSDLANLRPSLLQLTGIHTLNLSATRITDQGLMHLRGLPLDDLNLADTEVTDECLAELSQMPTLRGLRLDRTRVTDAGMAQLKGFRDLVRLELNQTRLSDAGLVHLGKVSSLGRLSLNGTQATDAGLAQLQGLRLGALELADTQVTDAGLANMKGSMQRMYDLRLDNTKVTDAGLENLKGLTGLSRLRLGNTKVTDAGLENLKGLTGLSGLGIGNTQVTDAGLVHLNGMPILAFLNLTNTQVTLEGIAKLKQRLPNLRVTK